MEYDISKAVKYFIIVIQNAAWQSTPNEKQIPKQPGHPRKIRSKIAEKKLRKVWQLAHHPEDKHTFDVVARQLKDVITRLKVDVFEAYVKGLSATDETDYSLWKGTRRIKRRIQHIPPIRHENQT